MAKVLDSGNPNFKEGDLARGRTGWEEYSLITITKETLTKIEHTDVPLSYYTGILGKLLLFPIFEITSMVKVANNDDIYDHKDYDHQKKNHMEYIRYFFTLIHIPMYYPHFIQILISCQELILIYFY